MWRDVHVTAAWPTVVALLLVALWALAAHWNDGLRTKMLWVATAVAQILVMLQVIVGVITLNTRDPAAPEASQTHTFYGFLTLVAITILYGYRNQLGNKRYLLYGLGGLFLWGLVVRAMTL